MLANLATETAQAFWATLIPHGLQGGALAHICSREGEEDDDMDGGWKDAYTQWWFDFLAEKASKGVSKDTWVMVSAPLLHSYFSPLTRVCIKVR